MSASAQNLSIASQDQRSRSQILGRNASMLEVRRLIDRVGPTEASVLITGESGSGKELIARLIHAGSLRSDGPFVAVNCGAIAAGSLEAELFGVEKAGGDGARRIQAGAFERAEGGTLFLDEITRLPLDLQTRLLRALETQGHYRDSGALELDTNVRLITACDRYPMKAVQKGLLREDLWYRLAVFPINVPPLRERGEDIELLAEHFLTRLNARELTRKELSAASRKMLALHSWPGNVRELKNCVERAFIVCDTELELVLLQAQTKAAELHAGRLEIKVGASIEEVERSLIEATLSHYRGNKRRTADTLGCSLKTLYNKLHVYARMEQQSMNS